MCFDSSVQEKIPPRTCQGKDVSILLTMAVSNTPAPQLAWF